MKRDRHHGIAGPLLLLAAVSVFSLAGCAVASQAQPQPHERIGFVRISVSESGAKLLSATSTPGRLKMPRGGQAPSAFTFDVLSQEGEIVWTGSFDDPLLERVEYVDDDGRLQSRLVEHQEAEVLIRVPVTASRHTIHVYRLSEATSKEAGSLFATLQIEF